MKHTVIIEVARPLFAPYFGAASPAHRAQRPRFDVEDLRPPGDWRTWPCGNKSPSCGGRAPKRLKVTAADRIF